MSIKNLSWALEETECKLGDRLVLIVMADAASDERDCCWLSIANIAKKARLSERHTQRCIRNLEEQGYLTAVGVDRSGTRIYRMNKGGVRMTPPSSVRQGVSPATLRGVVGDTQTEGTRVNRRQTKQERDGLVADLRQAWWLKS